MAQPTDKDEALKRLGGGRWQTRDERFTIEPQGGTWVVVDAEQSDDLGLPLVRGPFGSLRDAKTAIEKAREAEPAESPLNARVAELRSRPSAATATSTANAGGSKPATKDAPSSKAREPDKSKAAKPAAADGARAPTWLSDLEPNDRRRARRLIERLVEADAPDPEGMARRDLLGKVPTTAGYAIVRAILALGPGASPATVARLLVDGRDDELDVRWRLVDGAGRTISLDVARIDK